MSTSDLGIFPFAALFNEPEFTNGHIVCVVSKTTSMGRIVAVHGPSDEDEDHCIVETEFLIETLDGSATWRMYSESGKNIFVPTNTQVTVRQGSHGENLYIFELSVVGECTIHSRKAHIKMPPYKEIIQHPEWKKEQERREQRIAAA